MRYLGGKTRIANWLVEQITPLGGTYYLEPFLGGANSFVKLAPYYHKWYAGDVHEDLVLMWNALAEGWKPPDWISKEKYAALRHAEPSALRGFVGFGASWSGKCFGGYVDTVYDKYHQRETKPYLLAAKSAVLKANAVVAETVLGVQHLNYSEWRVTPQTLIYCDPPYAGTTEYNTRGFNHGRFWSVAKEWTRHGACVVVSEHSAPKGWKVLAVRERKHMLRDTKDTEQQSRTEKLFILGG